MERNTNYWNKGLPYLDGIEFYHALPFSPELGSAVLSGRTDYARIVDPGHLAQGQGDARHVLANYYQSVIQGTWPNAKKKPFDDPRVRRAVHLVFEQAVLVDVVKDVAPMMVGGFIYPFSEFATPNDQLAKRLGYQADPTAAIKEAKALMAAAGYGKRRQAARLPRARRRDLQAVGAGHPGHAAADRWASSASCARWWSRCGSTTSRSGNFDLAVGADRLDAARPVGLLQCLVQARMGRRTTRGWDNAEFNALMPQIDREVDPPSAWH